LASAMVNYLVAYAIYENKFPVYTPNPLYFKKIFKPTYPVLILVGTFDANTENGLGLWLQTALNAPSLVTLVNIPYTGHITVDPSQGPAGFCAIGIAANWWASTGKSTGDIACLSQIKPPDWDGSEIQTQGFSSATFGTPQLWNSGNVIDRPADTCSCATCAICTPCKNATTTTVASNNDCGSFVKEKNTVLTAILVPTLFVIVCLLTYIFVLRQSLSSLQKMSKQEEKL